MVPVFMVIVSFPNDAFLDNTLTTRFSAIKTSTATVDVVCWWLVVS